MEAYRTCRRSGLGARLRRATRSEGNRKRKHRLIPGCFRLRFLSDRAGRQRRPPTLSVPDDLHGLHGLHVEEKQTKSFAAQMSAAVQSRCEIQRWTRPKSMNGPIAQAVALTCNANGALLGRSPGEFLNTNTTAQFCDRVNFNVRQSGACHTWACRRRHHSVSLQD
jgi:hypothetical protein